MGILERIDAALKTNALLGFNADPALKQFFITGIQLELENSKQPVNTSKEQQTKFELKQIALRNQIKLQAVQENADQKNQEGTSNTSSDFGSIALGGSIGL